MKMAQKTHILYCALFLLLRCTSREIKSVNNPVFYSNSDVYIYGKLKNTMLPDERLKFSGYRIESDGNITNELEIELFNAERLPQDSIELNNVSMKIAKTVKLSLRDKKQYDRYKVVFITRPNEYHHQIDTSFTTIRIKDF